MSPPPDATAVWGSEGGFFMTANDREMMARCSALAREAMRNAAEPLAPIGASLTPAERAAFPADADQRFLDRLGLVLSHLGPVE